MTGKILRIATRKSPLALWQAKHVAESLRVAHPGLIVELIEMSTQGDRILDAPLAKVGGKGLFVKELEHALIANAADIAVHSMKDVPVELPHELSIAAILPRENPLDAFVSNHFASFQALPAHAKIGTSSLRRQCQIKARFPSFEILTLRGNVGTRLAKLDVGEFDGIVLATAGLLRLGLAHRVTLQLPAEESLPAVGQGAIGIECRSDDSVVRTLLEPLHDQATACRVAAERALNARLDGGCQVPIGAYAELDGGELWLRGMVGSPDGARHYRAEGRASPLDPERLGRTVAEDLLKAGAGEILADIYG